MPRLALTSHLGRYVEWKPTELPGNNVLQVLEAAFERCPRLRGYVVDEHGRLRKHVTLFIDGQPLNDTSGLSDPVGPHQEVFVMQALSGG